MALLSFSLIWPPGGENGGPQSSTFHVDTGPIVIDIFSYLMDITHLIQFIQYWRYHPIVPMDLFHSLSEFQVQPYEY